MKTPLVFLALLFSSLAAFGATDEQAQKTFEKLLAAQASKNYADFVSDATDEIKAGLSQTQFDAACDILNKRFKGGYDITFLGELNQKGNQIFLYRLRCKDGTDDTLGTMSLKGDKVSGILFH